MVDSADEAEIRSRFNKQYDERRETERKEQEQSKSSFLNWLMGVITTGLAVAKVCVDEIWPFIKKRYGK